MNDAGTAIALLIIAAGLGMFALAFFLYYPLVSIGLTLVIFVLDVVLLNGLPFIQLGRFKIDLLDALSALVILSAVIRLVLNTSRLNGYTLLLLALGGLLMISLMRGIGRFGVETAVVYLRPYLYFYSAVLAAGAIQYNLQLLHRFIFWWGGAAWLLTGLTFIRWFMVVFGLYQYPAWVAPGGLMTRVIAASASFFLLQTIIFSWTLGRQNNVLPFRRFIPFIMIPVIIILQHRTVWVIFAFILLCVFLVERRVRSLIFITSLVVGLIGVLALLVFWGSPLLDSLANSAQNSRTFDWRVAGWVALLSPARFNNMIDYAVGQPFGTGYERYLFGSSYAIVQSPHNFYVQTFLNIGGIGLISLLLIYFGSIGSLIAKRQDGLYLTFALMLITQLLYLITYNPSYEQGLLLGFAILMATNKKSRLTTI